MKRVGIENLREMPYSATVRLVRICRCSSGVEQLHGGPQSPAHLFREE
ncbi:MAG: hypothetical protein QG636_198 [Patescibacteria group bacterium]|nr:hypothetical protein [Patescibacteria group bacterium]